MIKKINNMKNYKQIKEKKKIKGDKYMKMKKDDTNIELEVLHEIFKKEKVKWEMYDNTIALCNKQEAECLKVRMLETMDYKFIVLYGSNIIKINMNINGGIKVVNIYRPSRENLDSVYHLICNHLGKEGYNIAYNYDSTSMVTGYQKYENNKIKTFPVDREEIDFVNSVLEAICREETFVKQHELADSMNYKSNYKLGFKFKEKQDSQQSQERFVGSII